MRNKDRITSPNSSTAGFRVESMMAGLVESSLIDVSDPNPIQHLGTQDAKNFNNQDMSGKLLQGHGFAPDPDRKDDEIAVIIEDVLAICM